MNKFQFDKLDPDSTACHNNGKKGNLGPKGDVGIKISNEVDYGFDYGSPHKKSKKEIKSKQNDDEYDDYDSMINFNDYDDYDYEFIKGKKNDDDFEYETQFDEFGMVKSFYESQLETNYIQKSKQAKFAAFFFAASVTCFIGLACTIVYEKTNSQQSIYITNSDSSIIQHQKEPIKSSELISNQVVSDGNKSTSGHTPKIESKPSIINNYNFDSLNSGLTTLGYSLLTCFLAFFSFKGLSMMGKSFRIKKEIKRSKQLIERFKQTISNQDNQLSISHLINDQMVINNILIERLNTNSHIVELIAINEKMKDTNQFINNELIKNLKES